MYIYTYMVITIILFIFSILVSSFSSTHKFYLFFLDSICHPTGKAGGVKERPCGAQPPASLNHHKWSFVVFVFSFQCIAFLEMKPMSSTSSEGSRYFMSKSWRVQIRPTLRWCCFSSLDGSTSEETVIMH